MYVQLVSMESWRASRSLSLHENGASHSLTCEHAMRCSGAARPSSAERPESAMSNRVGTPKAPRNVRMAAPSSKKDSDTGGAHRKLVHSSFFQICMMHVNVCASMSVEGSVTEGCIMCMLDKALAAYLLCSPNICAADFREAEHVCALQEEHVSEAAGDCG